jgi:hypothetical protein
MASLHHGVVSSGRAARIASESRFPARVKVAALALAPNTSTPSTTSSAIKLPHRPTYLRGLSVAARRSGPAAAYHDDHDDDDK